MVDDLDEHLHARGYAVDRIHGDIPQAQRDRVMEKFRRREFEFLIATDVAARGLDLDDLEVVFNYDLPNDAEDYTHRIGRTGRAGRSGRAFTFVAGQEIYKLQYMIRLGRLKMRRERIPSLDQVEEARDNVFFEKLRSTLDAGDFRRHDRMIDRLIEQGYQTTDISSALIHLLRGPEPAALARPAKPARAFHSVPPESPAVVVQPPLPRPMSPAEEPPSAAESPSRPRPPREPRGKHHSGGERKPRTGREKGFVPVAFNVGHAQLVTPADIVGKIAGVTRLPANAVGAIDIFEAETHVDVAEEFVDLVITKLTGIRIREVRLKPRRITVSQQQPQIGD